MPEESGGLDINKLLIEAAKAIGTSAYNKIKENFLEKWKDNQFEKEFGFPPKQFILLAEKVQKIGDETYFKRLKECIGRGHWTLPFIKIGICISELSDKGERCEIDKIRDSIHKKKGWKVLNIVNMGSTGAIRGVIEYLDDLSKKNYSSESIIQEFERIIQQWSNIAVFVHKENSEHIIRNSIREKIRQKMPIFFIFSYGAEANQIAMNTISYLRTNREIEPNDYLFDAFPKYDGVGTKVYMWNFKLSV
jgi:hypothetical protein